MCRGGAYVVKQTFHNLSVEKKRRIIEAIIQEVEQKSYEDISINQIVKNAGISRGSFYQYFDDKSDLLNVILHGFSDELSEKCKRYMIESDGDVFKACEKVFDFVVEVSKSKSYSVAFKIVFSFTNISENLLKNENHNHCENIPLLAEIKKYINRKLLYKNDDESIEYTVTIISSVLSRFWFEIFVLSRDYKEVKNELIKIFDLLKGGIYLNRG
jgi:AcrR family transcriptional regulator